MGGLSAIETALANAGNAAVAPLLRAGGAGFAKPPGYAAFSAGALGKFPYYWQVPSNLQFNATTYRSIRAGLKAGASPIELDGVFADQFAEVISDIFYTLSTADQSKLAQAQIEATNEQLKVLQAWQSTFGALPTDPTERSQPIDLIIGEIANAWAAPADRPRRLHGRSGSKRPPEQGPARGPACRTGAARLPRPRSAGSCHC